MVTLAGGNPAATVMTTEIMLGDLVELQRVTPRGAGGALEVGAIMPGRSFTIVTGSASDASLVYWRIHH
jgi:hypothetical protein